MEDLEPKKEVHEEKEGQVEFIQLLEIPFNILYILIGLPIMFFGYKYIRVAVSIVGLVGGNLCSLMLVSAIWDWDNNGTEVIIEVLVGCFLIGVLLAVILWYFPRFGYTVKCLVTGAIFGMQVYGISIGIRGEPLRHTAMLLIICSFAILGTFLGTLLKEYFFIVTTSYLGSFLVIRGIGTIIGNYPNVFAVRKKLPDIYY